MGEERDAEVGDAIDGARGEDSEERSGDIRRALRDVSVILHQAANRRRSLGGTSVDVVVRAIVRQPGRQRRARSRADGAAEGVDARAAAAPAAAVGRAAARPRHPLAARTVAASRARVGRWVGARRARAPCAQDASRAGTSGVSALSVEDRQNDGDGTDEPIEAIVVDAVEASDPMANERDAEDASTVGKPGGYDEDGVPLVDDGPCTTTEDGDEVCALPFPFAPPGEQTAPSDPNEKETPTKASVVDAEIENDHPTKRAAALMRTIHRRRN